jgi:hypothetical protein
MQLAASRRTALLWRRARRDPLMAEAGPTKIPVHSGVANAICERQTRQPADDTSSSPHRPTGQEPDGRRGALTCHMRWTSRSQARRYFAEEERHAYRKMLNLRPMRDGWIMRVSKFTSRIRH